MENINPVKSNFWLKVIVAWLYLPVYLVTTSLYLFRSNRFRTKTKFFSPLERTERTYKWLRGLTFFSNDDYFFVDEKNLLKTQTLYVVNKDINFKYFFIFVKIFKDLNIYNYSFFLQEKRRWHGLFRFLDIFYTKNKLPIFIKNKFSIICSWDKSKENVEIKELLKNNYLTIIPISIKEKKNFLSTKIFVNVGKPIKSHNFLDKDKSNIIKKISLSL